MLQDQSAGNCCLEEGQNVNMLIKMCATEKKQTPETTFWTAESLGLAGNLKQFQALVCFWQLLLLKSNEVYSEVIQRNKHFSPHC